MTARIMARFAVADSVKTNLFRYSRHRRCGCIEVDGIQYRQPYPHHRPRVSFVQPVPLHRSRSRRFPLRHYDYIRYCSCDCYCAFPKLVVALVVTFCTRLLEATGDCQAPDDESQSPLRIRRPLDDRRLTHTKLPPGNTGRFNPPDSTPSIPYPLYCSHIQGSSTRLRPCSRDLEL